MASRTFGSGRATRLLLWLLSLLAIAVALVAGLLWWGMQRSVPRSEGRVEAAGLEAPVAVARDALGTATVTAATRRDLALALGYLHAQDRYFQMDMLRRLAAGELSEISGGLTADIDKRIRVHRFRARARAMVAAMPADERALLDAYVAGVNRGLADLRGAPFEYLLTWSTPRPWTAEDSLLAVYAMYLNLQPATPQRELDFARAEKALGTEMAAFLYPSTTVLDAPIVGSVLPEPPMPRAIAPLAAAPPAAANDDIRLAEAVGSNNWAVGGALTATGAALVANDMHLGLAVPSTWYRARLVVTPAAGSAEPALDATGVTLPGTPFLVAGSNGRIAWGFTNSYIDTADAVIVEWVDRRAGTYRVPGGAATVTRPAERLCLRGACEAFRVEETIWGPIVGEDAFGRTIAMRWTAHNPDAVRLGAALALEQAGSVEDAIAVAHRSGIPQQNLMVGDAKGNIAWTIIGRIPRRIGFVGDRAVSFADGTRRWDGDLAPAETPVVMNPADHRLWTANSRVVGGAALARLGDGGYDNGARAGRIRDLLRANAQFAPADFLAIQLDVRATRNDWWAALMLRELEKRRADPRYQAMIAPVRAWGGQAVPGAVGYRLVDRFRKAVVEGIYAAWLGKPPEGGFRRTYATGQGEGAVRRLVDARPPALVPKGYRSWEAFLDEALADVADDVREAAGGNLSRYAWGADGSEVGRAGISHPLARAIAPLAWVTNPRDVAVPGDRPTVRAQAPGFGASERFAVSPGREAQGLFHMPGGQAGSPMTPWYLAGHDDWVQGRPTPFLPGPAKWRLDLVPARSVPSKAG